MRSRFLCAVAALLASSAMNLAAQVLVIRNATIVDARSQTPRIGQSILIRDGKIIEVGPNVAKPAGATVLEAGGKFLIPGMWDMHVHLDTPGGDGLLAAYIVNGVTGVRDMAGDWGRIQKWRAEVSAGKTVGPRIIASGPYLDGYDQPIPHILVKTSDDARRGVDSLKKLGVDVVKIHTGLTREAYLAAAQRAKELNIPFAGHVPRVVGAITASDQGQRSIEHMLTIPTPCTIADSIALEARFPEQRAMGPCSSASFDALFATLATNHTWVTPTYVAAYEISVWPKRAVPGDAYAQYLPSELKKFVEKIFPMPDNIAPDADKVGGELYRRRVALAGTMHRMGVHLLAGTDAPLRNSPPGFGLAEELAQFASGGVPLFDVLKIATWEPASYLAATDSMGTVEAGRVADLVLLREDPLTSVRAYRSVEAVVSRGRVIDSKGRQQILDRLKSQAR